MNNTTLSKDDAVRFYARIALDTSDYRDAIMVCINRSYRTAYSRLKGLGQVEPDIISDQKGIISELIQQLMEKNLSMEQFDTEHKKTCEALQESFNKSKTGIMLSVGRAQKWINMSLKHLVILSLADFHKATDQFWQNYKHFHIPVDSFIINHKEIKAVYSQYLQKTAWSNITNYDAYLEFQKQLRSEHGPLLDYEFDIWINT